jgi:hypothetical protein
LSGAAEDGLPQFKNAAGSLSLAGTGPPAAFGVASVGFGLEAAAGGWPTGAAALDWVSAGGWAFEAGALAFGGDAGGWATAAAALVWAAGAAALG